MEPYFLLDYAVFWPYYRNNAEEIGPELHRMDLYCIYDIYDDYTDHGVRSSCAQSSIYGAWCRGQYSCTVLHLKLSGWLGRGMGAIWLLISPNVSGHLQCRCHVALSHFAMMHAACSVTFRVSDQIDIRKLFSPSLHKDNHKLSLQWHQSQWTKNIRLILFPFKPIFSVAYVQIYFDKK